MTDTTRWDAADYLTTPEEIAAYLEAALEDGDPRLVTAALGDVARAKGITQIARQAGVTREGLSKALKGTGDPRLSTLTGVLSALGLRLSVCPIAPSAHVKQGPIDGTDGAGPAAPPVPSA